MPTNASIPLETIWGHKVRERRLALGFTQSELADLCALTQNAISKIELGQRSLRDSTKRRVARALGLSVDRLFPWDAAA